MMWRGERRWRSAVCNPTELSAGVALIGAGLSQRMLFQAAPQEGLGEERPAHSSFCLGDKVNKINDVGKA